MRKWLKFRAKMLFDFLRVIVDIAKGISVCASLFESISI